jgi:hypothetical protein
MLHFVQSRWPRIPPHSRLRSIAGKRTPALTLATELELSFLSLISRLASPSFAPPGLPYRIFYADAAYPQIPRRQMTTAAVCLSRSRK